MVPAADRAETASTSLVLERDDRLSPTEPALKAKANMGGIDLNVLTLPALFLEARAPRDYTVAAGVDRRRRDWNRSSQLAHPFRGRRLVFLSCEELPDRSDIARSRRSKGAPERDDHTNGIRNLTRDLTCNDAATAPADKANLQARVLPELRNLRGYR